MNSFYERQHIKFRYGPLAQKTLHNVLKRELVEQFGFENMGLIADGLIHRFLEILEDFDPKRRTLLPGQVLWLAVSRRHRGRLDQPLWRSKLVPVRLSQATVSRLIRNYQKRHREVLPFRGTVHDLGRTLTHKRQAVEWKLQGLLTQEIARRIHHTPEAVDAYLTDFERVYQLHGDGKPIVQIAFFTRIAQSVVRQYIELIDEYEITETRLEQLRRDRQARRRQNGQPPHKGRRHGQTRRRQVQ